MDLIEFNKLLDLYGSDVDTWPQGRGRAASQLLKVNEQARQQVQQQRQLDEGLTRLRVPEFIGLEQRIAGQTLPPQHTSLLDSVLDWLTPQRTPQLWRPALASCLPLVFGILLGNYFSFGISEQQLADEYWSDELYILALNNYEEGL